MESPLLDQSFEEFVRYDKTTQSRNQNNSTDRKLIISGRRLLSYNEKDSHVPYKRGIKTLNLEVSGCYLTDNVKEMYYSACGTCITVICSRSTNHITDLFHGP